MGVKKDFERIALLASPVEKAQEVARQLGLTPKMVEKHLRKGILRLTAVLFESRRSRPTYTEIQESDEGEGKHGQP